MPPILNSPSPSNKPPLSPPFPDSLNAEQKEAVLAPSGPLFVLAGAGTGKTRVIASRIAHLLQAGELRPAHILALTFSRRAAREMLERLRRWVGPSADEIGVFTFHGFCHRFLQDHAVELGLPARFRLLDQTESWVFFRRLLPELELVHHWNLADPTGCIESFLRFIHRAKDERVAPAEALDYARSLAGAQERVKAEEAARVYRLFQDRMRRSGNLDFGDLVVETLQALQGHPALLGELRSRYRAILVDEFQDTNVAQIELLKLLAGSGRGLCVVGDDDQAIYRFRGASFASFMLLRQAYPQVRTVRLTRNYRSTATILSSAQRLIRHNEPDRYDPEKRLSAETPGGAPVEILFCREDRHEAEVAVQTIRRILEQEASSSPRLHEIAVLYRAHAQRAELTEALSACGIPFSVRGGGALFEQPEIRDGLAYLQALSDPGDSVALFRLMSHPAWGIPAEDLAAVGQFARSRQQAPLDNPIFRPTGQALWGVLDDPELPVGSQTRASLQRLRSELSRLRRVSVRIGVQDLVRRIAEESFLRLGPASMGKFLRLAARYAENYPDENRLPAFLEYLDSVQKAGGEVAEADEEEDLDDRVRLMTVHQAKGLEFDRVIVLGLIQGRFPSRGRPEPIPFPVELMKEPLPRGDYRLQEERRLFYVACTRARKGLFLMTQERPRHRPSVFLREISEAALPGQILEKRQELSALAHSHAPSPSAVPRLSQPTVFSAGSKFSYTQLEAYRTCPLKYLYAYAYRIPVRATPQMNFGSDLHAALEIFFQEIIHGKILPLEDLLDSFRRRHTPGRYGEPGQDERYRQFGLDLLTAYTERHQGKFPVPLFVEKSFSLQLEEALTPPPDPGPSGRPPKAGPPLAAGAGGGVTIQGVIDRIDPLPSGGIEIVDYKSGKPKEEAGFPEQLQLWLYALAAREALGLEPERVAFYYLQGNSKLTFDRKPQTLEETRQEILGIVRSIRSGNFEPKPALMKCCWCAFRTLCPASLA